METDKKLNILVMGGSGAGKTTLINSISGIDIKDGSTKKISVYESSEWPFRFIDTKGFEYNVIEQLKTIWQIKKYSKKKIRPNNKDDNDNSIDVVWYCIEGTSRRAFEYNIKLMKKALIAWKNVPVFVVITKSYSETDIPQNIEEIKTVFSHNKSINLKEIIPVVAEEYIVDKDLTVPPKGIEELCINTIDCFDEAKQISKENRLRLILNQKKFTAQTSVITTAGIGASIAFVDKSNIVDSTLLTPLEVGLTKLIFKIYGVKYSQILVDKVVGGSAITSIAKYIVGHFDKSQIVDAVVAGTVIFVLGESVIGASEASYKGLIEFDKIDEFIKNKIESSKIVSTVIDYINNNMDKLKKSNSQEIANDIKHFLINNKNKTN